MDTPLPYVSVTLSGFSYSSFTGPGQLYKDSIVDYHIIQSPASGESSVRQLLGSW